MSQATGIQNIPTKQNSIFYPESDGKPIAENTVQYNWIERIKGNLEYLFAADPAVFIAADNLWYPVEGRPNISVAPDVYVAFGRPKGDRPSYKQWEEGGITPQVVFEIWSPGNTPGEIVNKYLFYDRYGVEEYYAYDPDPTQPDFTGWVRSSETGRLEPVTLGENGFTSPRLGIRFDMSSGALVISLPNGEPFKTMVELAQEREQALHRASQAEERAARLAAQLRALGIEPES